MTTFNAQQITAAPSLSTTKTNPKERFMKALRRSAIAAVALAAALTLSACGSDDMDTAAETTTEQATTETIVDVAVGAGNFTTLVAAVTAADLVETLSGEGPFTVFAPTDEAFAALPAGVLDALLLPENKAILAQILTYHVVSGQVLAADVTDSDVATVEGQTIKLSTANGVTVNGATVVAADVMASNGVIHAIDAVILPPGVDVAKLIKK
jgi:uncharacterized surface protein with fasciclin (FAS1) repeats